MMKKAALLVSGFLLMGSAVVSAAIPAEEIALGGLRPGMTLEAAKAIYGEPTKISSKKIAFDNGFIAELDFHNGTILEEIKSVDPDNAIATPSGLVVGAEEAAIESLCGPADEIERKGQYTGSSQTKYTYYATDARTKMKITVHGGVVTKIKCELRD